MRIRGKVAVYSLARTILEERKTKIADTSKMCKACLDQLVQLVHDELVVRDLK